MVLTALPVQTTLKLMDRLISNRFHQLLKKSIPVHIMVGMFFFCAYSWAGNLELAVDLFEKNDWDLCQRECRRALLSKAEPIERFSLLEALSSANRGADSASTAQKLQHIVTENRDTQVTGMASYELGRLQWQFDDLEAALNSFQLAFQTTTNKTLFLRSSCSIYLLIKEAPELKAEKEDVIHQVGTVRDQWYGALFAECAKPDPSKNEPQAPNWIVRFYRSQISPAIGNRCTLEPSCSEYFHQAHQHHGLKSFPMIADRFFREPEVSNQKKDPVVMKNGQIRYQDPLENHDFWMKKK